MSVSFGGLGEEFATFETYGTISAGMPVKMYGNGKVQACADGERFIGIAVDAAEDGCASVQMKGYAELPYSGTAPAVGIVKIAAAAGSKVKVNDAGGEYIAVTVDTVGGKVGIIM